jgi:hypothetical protein
MAAVVLITSISLGTTGATFVQKAFADPLRCVSTQDNTEDESTTTMNCYSGPDSKELAKEAKDDCKAAKPPGAVDKCSSSQTGFGEVAKEAPKPDRD